MIYLLTGLGVILAGVALALFVVFIRRRREDARFDEALRRIDRDKAEQKPEAAFKEGQEEPPEVQDRQGNSPYGGSLHKTMVLGGPRDERDGEKRRRNKPRPTRSDLSNAGDGAKRSYEITLTDRSNEKQSFTKRFVRELMIGRAESSDIVLTYDMYISGHHCLIADKEGTLYIEDAGSANGTALNGKGLDGPAQIRSGDVIRLGRVEMDVKLEEVKKK